MSTFKGFTVTARLLPIFITLAISVFASQATASSDSSSYVGAWKGITYTGSGTYPDILLNLNSDGSYSCSGYPLLTPGATEDTWTPWRVICATPEGQANKWELILPSVIRFTHNNPNTKSPMSIVSVSLFDGKTLILDLPTNLSTSLSHAEFSIQ